MISSRLPALAIKGEWLSFFFFFIYDSLAHDFLLSFSFSAAVTFFFRNTKKKKERKEIILGAEPWSEPWNSSRISPFEGR
jgi:hypothetical protein